MQIFEADPTDSQLAVLLNSDGRSVSLRIEDSPARLRVIPRGYSLWFVASCVLTPLGLWTGYLAYKAPREGLHAFDISGFVAGCLAALAFITFSRWMNRRMTARGEFFSLDKVQRILALPRLGVLLREGQLCCFVELRAWYTERMSDGSNSTWVGELSVLVRSEHGRLSRYPILMCARTDLVARVAKALAEFFGVERRLLELNWRTRRRLEAEAAGPA